MQKEEIEIDQVKIACQNDAVPKDSQGLYIARGLWVTDFQTGHSFRKEDAPKDDQRGAAEVFNRIVELSQFGGVGTVRGKHTDLIAVGRFGTNGIQLINTIGDRSQKFKAVQFEEYAIIGPSDKEYEEVATIANTKGGAVATMSDEQKSRLNKLFTRLRMKGLLRTPVR